MKKSLLLIWILLVLSMTSFSNNEKLYVAQSDLSGDFFQDVATSVPPQAPCTEMFFKVTYTFPEGYSSVIRFDWYINGTFIKSTTAVDNGPNGMSGPALIIVGDRSANAVVCKVIYRKTSDGTASSPYASPAFIIVTKDYDFSNILGPNNIDVGARSVSYSINPGPGNTFQLPPGSGTYRITWQSPPTWSQTSLTNNGRNVSYNVDDYTAGTLTATISLIGCSYRDTRTLQISRSLPAPSYSSANPNKVCGSSQGNTTSATFSISTPPLASSFTYYISPYFGDATNISFSGNGQQTITTTSSSVEVNFANTSDQIITLGVKANYPNGGISPATTVQIPYSVTPVQWAPYFNFTPNCFCANERNTSFKVDAPFVSGGYYFWYMDGFMVDQGYSQTSYLSWNGESNLSVRVQTNCGISDLYSEPFPICPECSWYSNNLELSVYPNPVSSELTINLKQPSSLSNKDTKYKKNSQNWLKQILEVRILDKLGNVKKVVKYLPETKTVKLDIKSLPTDVYIIEILDGKITKKVRFSKVN